MSNVIRYVSSNSGVNVRKTAAGEIILALGNGELMYDIVGVSRVTASLNGVPYVWVKVHYYHINSDSTTSEGEGWVTEDNVTKVNSIHPTKADVCYNGTSLQYNRFINARYIYDYLRNDGWTANAIYAVLGNMERESSINPTSCNSASGAYGLVHWCPANKLTAWLPVGANAGDIDNQLSRIVYEAHHEEQWLDRMPDGVEKLTFAQFIISTKAPTVLAEYFVRCYEGCGGYSTEIPIRSANTKKWWQLISLIG